jgi:redox-sensitive bicupin YhaK (pirin superfamily)
MAAVTIRKSSERGHFDHGWLDTYHTFSFGDYRDPAHMGFRSLRVINEDVVAPGQGFGMHPHRDMEIITYILEGELEHRDSMGNGEVLRPGEVQRMTAGSGVLHSEFNHSRSNPVHLLQIWLYPERKGLEPGYEQKAFPVSAGKHLDLLASSTGEGGSVRVHQDVRLYRAVLPPGVVETLAIAPGRGVYVQVARGRLRVNGKELVAGDAAAIEDLASVELEGIEDAEALVFDLA